MDNFQTPYNIKSDYGFIHVYALTMTLGIILSVLASYIKAHKKGLPSNVLLISIIFIIPASLLSASFFGKVDFTDFEINNFFAYFEFWDKSGGMSIHGGVLGGVIVSMIYFIYPSKKYQISLFVWLDAIVPNILIGQAIGRWGNFFNHELLGKETSLNNLSWLPNWISHNCWQWANGNNTYPEGYDGSLTTIIYRQPIFLYESFGDIIAWLFITFVISNAGRLLGPKPWKKHSNIFKTSFGYSFKKFFKKNYTKKGFLSYKQIWDEVYYEKKISNSDIKSLVNDKNYSKNLQSLHNPDRYWIIKAGAQGGAYFFLWNIIRLVLETQRENDELFLMNLRKIDYTIIFLISMIGIVIILISQFYAPYRFRKPGWVYEKEF